MRDPVVNTFLPYPSLEQSLAVLDLPRLGKQRVETKQILRALREETRGWRNHPAARMWRGHEGALVRYGLVACERWRAQGYADSLLGYFTALTADHPDETLPPWFGTSPLHRSHQSNLVRKWPEFYRPIFGDDVPDDLPYHWPV
ncbi:MAG: MSMEG_6728 family protein [Candidatus Nanopelagicales bacterium]|nr:MSMEG_6728 family protein [Candidatus Nanopelagicales bacterium]